MSSLSYTKKTNFVCRIYQNSGFFLSKNCTSYSQFGILIKHDEHSIFVIKKNSSQNRFFIEIDLIVWNEVSMQHKHCFEIVNKLFKNLHFDFDESAKFRPLFDGVLIVFDEDFVQILFVIEHDGRFDVVNACFQKFYIWPQLIILKFKENMRVNSNNDEFLKWINKLFFDSILNDLNKIIFFAFIFITNSMKSVIESIYSLLIFQKRDCDLEFFRFWIFLITLNTIMTDLNKQIVDFFVDKNKTYENNNSTNVRDDENIVWKFSKILRFFNFFFEDEYVCNVYKNLCLKKNFCNNFHDIIIQLQRNNMQINLLKNEHDK